MPGINYKDHTYVENANPCALCKRMIINSGIKEVIIRDIKVQEYIDNDESLEKILGY